MSDKGARSLPAIWATPLAVGVIIAAGLAAALLLEGPAARMLVCTALSVPLLTIAYCSLRRRGHSTRIKTPRSVD